jgi:hypothetical protein
VDVVLPEVTPLEADLTYPKHPIKIQGGYVTCISIDSTRPRSRARAQVQAGVEATLRTIGLMTGGPDPI